MSELQPPRKVAEMDLSLFGEGHVKAYRESNGPFTAVDELLEVKGIGKALLEKNRGRLVIN